MRYAIIADIHANLAAFEAVLDDMDKQGDIDRVWCLGDIVGYGPDPHECIELMRDIGHACIAGNHDRGSIGKFDIRQFNQDAADAVRWTAEQLGNEDIRYLESLPDVLVENDFTLVHGSPRRPLFEYILSISIAQGNFDYYQTKYCLTGHTHIPQVYSIDEDSNCITTRFTPNIKLVAGEHRLIINPGAVGQPRDGDSRASYAVYDGITGVMQLRRVKYNIRMTQNKMVSCGLPLRLAGRLDSGR